MDMPNAAAGDDGDGSGGSGVAEGAAVGDPGATRVAVGSGAAVGRGTAVARDVDDATGGVGGAEAVAVASARLAVGVIVGAVVGVAPTGRFT